nr:RHS repeat-associated core domain-containing protein [Lysinibacter cavernae]
MYGSDPISFSTGNLIETEPLFSLEGAAGQAIDLTLVYNSQDGRLTRTGAGWSFGLGARAQRFDDGSAMVVRGDGASFMFNPDGAGGFVSEPGVYQTLTAGADGRLTLKSNEGETWVFDTSDIEGIGELVSQTDRAGNTYTLAYGAATDASQFLPLASITDASGQIVQVGSDALGRVSTFRHPDGRVWTLNYNGAGDLVNITNPDGRVRGFTYDDKHQLLTATDAKNVTYLRNEYDAEGRVVKQWDAEGTLRKLAYDPAKGQTTYTDNEGSTTIFRYDSKFRITGTTEASGVTTGYTYDDKNQVTSYTNEAGDVWKYTYDGAGNLTKETKPDGSWLRYTYTPTGEVASVTDQGGPDGTDRTTSFEINGRGQVTATHFPDGTIEKRQYDAAGNLTVITSPGGGSIVKEYDGKGNLTKTTDKAGAVTTFVYDLANRVVSQTDAMGGVTTYAYDGGDRVVSQTDPRGGVTSFTYDQNDHLIKQVDPVGAETSYVWDDLFRMVQQTAPDGGVTEYTYTTEDELTKMVDPVGAVTEFELDAQYRAVTTVDPAGGRWERELDKIGNVLKTVDPEGAETATEYDRAGRVTKSVDATGIVSSTEYDIVGRPLKQTTASADGTLESTTSMTYDIMDRVVTVTDPAGRETSMTYDVDGNVLSQTDAAGRVSQNIYDVAGRVTSTVNPVGDTTTIVYDVAGNVLQSTDEAGRVSTFTYDQSGLVLTETDPLGNVVSHEYDVLGREIAVTDANGNRTSTAYTVAGQIASVTDALGGVTTYGYDLAGRQISLTNARGNETKYVYDVSGQLTEVIEGYLANPLESLGGSGETPTGDALESAMAKVGSDVNSTTTFEWSSTGQKVKQISPTKAETVFEYDASGRVLSERNALGKQWTYQYDGLGRLLTESDANGASKKYEYDEAGQVTKVGQVSFEYDAVGQMIAMTDPEGVSGWKYDELGQMTEQIDVLGAKVRYEYDPTGLMTKLTMPKNQVVEYTYDAAGRPLALQSDAGAVAYEWDAAGNLARMVRNSSASQDNATASGTKAAAVEEISEQPAPAATGVVTSYAYDALNRPVSITHQTLNENGLTSANPNLTQKQKVRRLIPSGTEQVTCINASGYLADREAVSSLGRDCVKSWDYLADRTLPSPVSPVAAGDAIVFDYTYDEAGNVSEATRSIGNASVIAALKQAVIAPDDSVDDGAAEGTESEGPADVDPAVLATIPGLTQEQRDQLLASPLAPAVDTRGVSYDRMDRMVGVASSDGVTETFAYDRGGNRTLSRVESPGGIRETKSTFNEVDQLLSQVTSTPAKVELPAASASRSDALISVPGEGTEKSVTKFEYDSNGNRIKRNVDGEQTSYEYNDENRLTKVTSLERVSEFGYDGLGREVKQSDTTELGTSETTSTWSGDSVVQQTTKTETSSKAPFQAGPNTKQLTSPGGDAGEVTTLVRDSFGDVALQSKGGEASWSLLDNLGSTAAQAVGGQVTDLASYSAWGVQMFESSGWDAVTGFTGERSDPGYGLNNYFSRTYDPSTGVWLSQDSWRGLIEQPQSLARYGYVTNNPASLVDVLGYKAAKCYTKYTSACGLWVPKVPQTALLDRMVSSGRGIVATPEEQAYAVTPRPYQYMARPSSNPNSPVGVHKFVPDRHCRVLANGVSHCVSEWTTGIDLPIDLLGHFYFGGGATYNINWNYFRYDQSFYDFAYNIPVGDQRSYAPLVENHWMYMAIGTYNVSRVSMNCFEIYDHYDFEPDKVSNLPYHFFDLADDAGFAESFAVRSYGCF